MGVTLERVQNKFACIIGELCSEPVVLSKFAIWLDLRLAEYKAKGAISLDCSGENPDPIWLKGHEKDVVVAESPTEYCYSPPQYQRNTLSNVNVHRPSQQFSSGLPESAETVSAPAKVVCKKESDDEVESIFPVSLHRVDSSQDRKRSSTDSLPRSFSNSSHSKVRRFAEYFPSGESDHASNQGILPSPFPTDTQGDDNFDQSNDTDNGFLSSVLSPNQSAALSQSGADNSLTFSCQDSILTDSVQQTTSLQSKTGDISLSQDPAIPEFKLERLEVGHPTLSWDGKQGDTEAGPSAAGAHFRPTFPDRTFFSQKAKRRIVGAHGKSRNTIGHLSGAVGTLEHWLATTHRESRPIESIPPEELNTYLAQFFAVVKRPNGKDYEGFALSTMKSYLDRFLKEHDYPQSISQSPVFRASRISCTLRRNELKAAKLKETL